MPVELLNKRGTVVMLPEGLTANFARSIARSGNAATRVKRYCFDKVYHDSLVGGHPRENLDASFDIGKTSIYFFCPKLRYLLAIL